MNYRVGDKYTHPGVTRSYWVIIQIHNNRITLSEHNINTHKYIGTAYITTLYMESFRPYNRTVMARKFVVF